MPLKITESILIFSDGVIGHKTLLDKDRMIYNPQGVIKSNLVIKQNKNTSELRYHRDSQQQHKDGYKLQGENYPTNILEFSSDYNTLHPTQKPVALMSYLIRTYTNPGELILDNTMGSGTTLVAAQNEGRRAIGIEISEEYCRIAVDRLRQPSFFSLPNMTPEEKPEQATLF